MRMTKQSPPLGKRLMKMRKEKNMSLSALAHETGLNSTYIVQIEKGEVIPPVSVILQLHELCKSIRAFSSKKKGTRRVRNPPRLPQKNRGLCLQEPDTGCAAKAPESFQGVHRAQVRSQGGQLPASWRGVYLCARWGNRSDRRQNQSTLKPDECIHFNSSITHRLRNLSEVKAELLVILYTP